VAFTNIYKAVLSHIYRGEKTDLAVHCLKHKTAYSETMEVPMSRLKKWEVLLLLFTLPHGKK
jgi:hypothetical protein